MSTTPLTVWLLDGVEIDLTRTQIDVDGGRWVWTGASTEAGEPLMRCGDDGPLPLSEVYATYGPLIPAPAPITHADRYAAYTACPAETTAKEKRTPSTFAAFLGGLSRRTV
ncbi:phiSA1p31-related protein [Streptomyces sp. NBC_01433]|uniref:phiSA1p31-related protein n=1 Tax=Streptomyces sp. NBC_01433 TaxID=2903864 RepID=UPI002255702A|nr:phiSA1p31-related protein [Streptomyces sp. NBC_01433]MCX4676748.1 phiSA1p31-related protein [Streptomyces sp. NBC_01433]